MPLLSTKANGWLPSNKSQMTIQSEYTGPASKPYALSAFVAGSERPCKTLGGNIPKKDNNTPKLSKGYATYTALHVRFQDTHFLHGPNVCSCDMSLTDMCFESSRSTACLTLNYMLEGREESQHTAPLSHLASSVTAGDFSSA